ncbi:MAG: zinc ribbon domain-containing protein [Clostridia bacterium]|nr:zinc ribbon domain-containing protein [Clostridia bacterium]
MICPFCKTENPDHAVFCKKCGNKVNQTIICPDCKKECAAGENFCPDCGAKLPEAIPVPSAAAVQGKPKLSKEERREKSKKSLNLASGILMMAAVFFSLIFVFFLGTTQKVRGGSSQTETYMIWHYFGRAYSELGNVLSGGNSGYTITSYIVPLVLTTLVAAGTLGSVVALSLISIVKFGLHFKNPNVRYYKFAVAAVFTFLLGATFFDCIHSVSTESAYGELSSATEWGMALSCIAIITSLVLKTAEAGLGVKNKQNIVDCVLSLAGILILGIIAGTASSAQAKYTVTDYWRHTYHLGFYHMNRVFALQFNSVAPADFVATYVLAVFAQIVQIALIVLAFIVLMKIVVNFSENRTSFPLGISIALVIVAAVYLVLSVLTVEFAHNISGLKGMSDLRLAGGPVMPFVFSVFLLAVTITHKALAKKLPDPKTKTEEEQQATTEEETKSN